MPTKLDPGNDRTEACWIAVERLRLQGLPKGAPPKSVNQTAHDAGFVQQTLNNFVKSRKLGIDFADQIAAAFETTVDGLVWLFLRGGEGAVRVGDIPGWKKAVDEAKAQGWDYPYELAAEARLPAAPSVATAAFARDLARLLHDYARATHTRIVAQRATK